MTSSRDRLHLAAVTVITVLLGAGCGGLGQHERDALERGASALDSGRWTRARIAYTDVIDAAPEWGPAYLGRARSLLALRKLGAALSDLELAISRELLEPEELAQAWHLRGRCLVESGRDLLDDRTFRAGGVSDRVRRESRDLFLSANIAFRSSLELHPGDYDASFWRAFSLYRQENHTRALEMVRDCEKLRPGGWRHRLLEAQAWEGVNGLNTQSVAKVLAVAGEHRSAEALPVFHYLVDLCDEVPAATQEEIASAIERYLETSGTADPAIMTFVANSRQKRERDRQAERLAATLEEARRLIAAKDARGALAVLEDYSDQNGPHPEVTALVDQVNETRSRFLESRATAILDGRGPKYVVRAIETLERAASLTRQQSRREALRARIARIQAEARRHRMVAELRAVNDLLRERDWKRLAGLVARIDPRPLAPAEREFLFFVRGAVHHHRGRHADAIAAFRAVPAASRDLYDGLPLWLGLSLLARGDEAGAYPVLSEVAVGERPDDVNRRLARYRASRGEHAEVIACVSAIERPTAADRDLEAHARAAVAAAHFRDRRYAAARSELVQTIAAFGAASQPVPVETIALLATTHVELDEIAAARSVYVRWIEAWKDANRGRDRRELYLSLGRLELEAGRPASAYEAWKSYRDAGGELPQDTAAEFARLFAAFEDFLPLDRVGSWRYTVRGPAGAHTVQVGVEPDPQGDDAWRVTWTEGDLREEETWRRDGPWVVRQRGDATFRLPVRADAKAERDLPIAQYDDRGQPCGSELVAYDQHVRLQDGREFARCLKVRTQRRVQPEGANARDGKCFVWLAPDVGEVRREIFVDDRLVAAVELESVHFRD